MRGAKPVQEVTVDVKNSDNGGDEFYGGEHTVYKWIVPWEKEPARE